VQAVADDVHPLSMLRVAIEHAMITALHAADSADAHSRATARQDPLMPHRHF
jgi:hypothetical protein